MLLTVPLPMAGCVRFFTCFYNVIRTEEGKYYTATLLFCEKDVKN